MAGFQPMLAAAVKEQELEKLIFPGYVSPKLDGVRAIIKGGVVLSRKLKPFPSKLIQSVWGRGEFEGLDGELITGPPNAADVFRRTQSVTSTIESNVEEINATHFHIFDCVADAPYQVRMRALEVAAVSYPQKFQVVPQQMVHTVDELRELEEFLVQQGFEGAMYRSLNGRYKFGRSTLREGYLLKIKRFADDEYEVTGFEEKLHNANELQTDERGYAKRSSHQENLVGTGMLGVILGRALTGPYAGRDIKVTPTGPHQSLEEAQKMLGTVRVFKYFPSGSKDAPRFPTDKGPRHD